MPRIETTLERNAGGHSLSTQNVYALPASAGIRSAHSTPAIHTVLQVCVVQLRVCSSCAWSSILSSDCPEIRAESLHASILALYPFDLGAV